MGDKDQRDLTMADVERLLADPSAQSRSHVAERLGASYAAGRLSEREREIADDIVRAIARDVEIRVRAALSRSIRMSPHLPRDVAVRLANDVAEVAIPILEASSVLSDDDLIAVVRNQHSDAHLLAITRRLTVSDPVGSAIVDSGDAPAVTSLIANPGAALAEPTLERIVDGYARDQNVADILSERSILPLRIAERLVTLVTSELHRKFGGEGADLAVAGAGHPATELLLLDPEGALLDLAELLWRLIDEERLGPDFVVDAAEAGDRGLVEVALSRLSGLSIGDVRRAISGDGFMALLETAGVDSADRQRVRDLMAERRLKPRSVTENLAPEMH